MKLILVIMFWLVLITPAAADAYEIDVVVTAYCQDGTMGGRSDGLTASGIYAIPGVSCAADGYDFGTVFRLPDGREFVCHDRIGHGRQNHIDLYLSDIDECFDWGRKHLTVEVIELEAEKL